MGYNKYSFFGLVFLQSFQKRLHPGVKIVKAFAAGKFWFYRPFTHYVGYFGVELAYLLKGQPFNIPKVNLHKLNEGSNTQLVFGGNDFGGQSGTAQGA